jgi:hypothetical protein
MRMDEVAMCADEVREVSMDIPEQWGQAVAQVGFASERDQVGKAVARNNLGAEHE